VTPTDRLLADAADRAARYLADLDDRRVAPAPPAVAALDSLDTSVPERGTDPAEVLALLDEVGSPATVATAGPRYFGFVTGGTHPAGLAAAVLALAWDQNAALSVMSPTAARLDAIAVRWIAELLGMPAGTDGAFVTGATMANATALAAARDHVLAEAGWDAREDGLLGAPPVTVVVGAEAHTTVHKALGLVGLGRRRVVTLPVDDQGRIVPVDLPALTGPAIVCLQAGNVNSGASDPFGPLVSWARAGGAWVHVDGAFGLWAAACPETAAQVEGVQDADSWALDAHKWLNSSYDSGVVLVRDPAALRAAFGSQAAYLPGSGREPMHVTPQTSQRARGVEAWAIIRSLGRDGVAELVRRCCAHAARLADELRAEPGVEVCNDVVLNQVVLRIADDDTVTAAVLAAVQADGTCWCGPTVWRGRSGIRVSVSSWRTTADDIDRSVAAIRTAIRAAAGGAGRLPEA
jgi:glutamate/tyrosine decarboxylase-like PLP-dependent enzyme